MLISQPGCCSCSVGLAGCFGALGLCHVQHTWKELENAQNLHFSPSLPTFWLLKLNLSRIAGRMRQDCVECQKKNIYFQALFFRISCLTEMAGLFAAVERQNLALGAANISRMLEVQGRDKMPFVELHLTCKYCLLCGFVQQLLTSPK